MRPPAALTKRAISAVWASLSMEQGPPITTMGSLPPILTPETSTTVSAGWNTRLASL